MQGRDMPSTPDLLYPDKTEDMNTLIIRISKLLKELSCLTGDNLVWSGGEVFRFNFSISNNQTQLIIN